MECLYPDHIVIEGHAVVDPNVIYGAGRHPRTAVGFTRDRRTMAFVVVDGRSGASAGVTMPEFRELLLGLGLFDALNMDGGGSSTLFLAGRGVVNHPSDGVERAVANHLGVVLREAPGAGSIRAWCVAPQFTPRGEQAPDEPSNCGAHPPYVAGERTGPLRRRRHGTRAASSGRSERPAQGTASARASKRL